MFFLPTDTSHNPWLFRSGELSSKEECGLPAGDNEITLSLEQVAPLLQGVEVDVLASQRIYDRADLRALTVPFPCHLRVPIQGGIGITVANRIDAIAACQTLLSRKVNGAFPEYLLVEEAHGLEQELSLGITLDEQSGEVMLWGSQAQQLGASSSPDAAEVERVCFIADLEAEDGLTLASQLGLEEVAGEGITRLLDKLYLMMTWTGITSCSLESLALRAEGEVIALQGQFKFGINSPLKHQAQAAMGSGDVIIHPTSLSHGQLSGFKTKAEGISPKRAVIPQTARPQNSNLTRPDRFAPPDVVRLGEGNIAVLSNDFRRTMDSLERIQRMGGSVAAFVNLQDGLGVNAQSASAKLPPGQGRTKLPWSERAVCGDETAPAVAEGSRSALKSPANTVPGLDAFSLKRQLCEALQALDRLRDVKVVLINWRSTQLPCRILADALVEYRRQVTTQARRSSPPLSLVVRLTGEGAAGGYQRLKGEEIETEMELDGAIARCMGLARMGRGS